MIRKLIFVASLTYFLSACGGGSSGGGDDEPQEPGDTNDSIVPTISCGADLNAEAQAGSNDAVVSYNAPVGADNLPGAVTSQTEGLASGEAFPIGSTTNTFEVSDAASNVASCSFTVTVTAFAGDPSASDRPYFADPDPAPVGQTWVKVENLSDEFNDDVFDETKWTNTDSNRWIGRAPGLFVADTVSESDGNLRLTPYQLNESQEINGNTFTHAGSNIYSREAAQLGDYFEARMKAGQTFMSSTFWLINTRNEGTGCDVRVTELDIQEAVGQVTGSANFAQSFDQSMHSNTHSRQTSCAETPTGSAGNNASTNDKVWESYNIYGAWWKSASEIEFYLNGELVYIVNPVADFDLPLYMRMVVETYDWNPPPANGGMTGTDEQRTTYYDWVRTWRLQ